ncbi:MAG: helix-turn-helix transcriptional regulator [Nocardioides sp.]
MTTTPAATTPRLLTSPEVAAMLAVSNATLCRWRAAGRGPRCYWLTPDAPRYRESDVLAWLETVAS